jgi:large subunit ribosomal protein L30
MQCGLSWSLMLKKREIFRECFDGFDYDRIADYTEADIDRILSTEGMIRSRGKIAGDKDITDDYLKENSEFSTVEELAKAIIENDYRMKDVEAAKPVFRLHPPVKGYEGNKRSYKNGGALGYRGEAINDLIARML